MLVLVVFEQTCKLANLSETKLNKLVNTIMYKWYHVLNLRIIAHTGHVDLQQCGAQFVAQSPQYDFLPELVPWGRHYGDLGIARKGQTMGALSLLERLPEVSF